MGKPLKQGELVVRSEIIDGASPPAIRKAPNGFKRFRILREIADRIVEEQKRLCELRRELRRSLWLRRRESDDDEPLPEVADAQLSDWVVKDIARCRALLGEIDRADFYEVDDEGDRVLKMATVAGRLALAYGNARGGASGEAEAAAKMVMAHVVDAEPDYLVLEDACRDIEATQKFIPATAEMLEKISEHRGAWMMRRHAVEAIERTSRELQNEIAEAHGNLEAEQAEAKVRRAELDVSNKHTWFRHAKEQAIAKQESFRKGYQEIEAAMTKLTKAEELLEESRAALAEAIEARSALSRREENR